jgi:hypothetical protein
MKPSLGPRVVVAAGVATDVVATTATFEMITG